MAHDLLQVMRALCVVHMICTRLHLGHLSVHVGDSSQRSEEIVKKILKAPLKLMIMMILLLLLLLLLNRMFCSEIVLLFEVIISNGPVYRRMTHL